MTATKQNKTKLVDKVLIRFIKFFNKYLDMYPHFITKFNYKYFKIFI